MRFKCGLFFRLFLVVFVLFVVGRIYYRATDDFRMANITYDFKNSEEWLSPRLTKERQEELSQILDQKFTYIGKGAQCYAFASADGKYVLKFFKFKHLTPGFWVNWLPDAAPFSEWKSAEIERKKVKRDNVFRGYQLAFQENQDGSGLLYLHFSPTHYFQKKAVVTDKLGFEREIDLDSIAFLLQKKGETFRARLHYLLGEGDIQGAKNAIEKIIAMYLSEYKNGTYDRDHGVMHNTGFIGDQPFHLDIGKFYKEEKMQKKEFYKEDLKHISWKIDTWIKKFYPKEYSDLSQKIAELYVEATGEELDVDRIDPAPYLKNKKISWFPF